MHIAIAVNGDLYVRILAALVCWISPDTSISKRGRVRSGRGVIYWFLTAATLLLTPQKKWEQLFFGDTVPHLASVFFKLGCVPVLRSLIRILRASCANWYGNDQEILQSALRGTYAVSINTHMSNTARYSSRIAFFAYPTCIWRPR